MISPLRRACLKLWRRRRAYPIRKHEMCVCGKIRTRKINGEFIRHKCGDQNAPTNS